MSAALLCSVEIVLLGRYANGWSPLKNNAPPLNIPSWFAVPAGLAGHPLYMPQLLIYAGAQSSDYVSGWGDYRFNNFYDQSISAEPEVDPVYDNLRDILDGRTVAQPRFSDSTSPSSGSGDLDTAAADASVDETGAAAQDEVPQEETIEAAPETAAFPVVAGNAFSGTAERQGADVNRFIEDSRQLSVFGFSPNSNVLQNALGNSGIGNQPLPGLNNVSVAALRGSKMDVTNFVTSPSVDPLSNASLTAESPSNGFLTGQTLRSMFVGSAVIQKKTNLCVVQLTGNFQRSGTCVSSVALVNMCDGMGIKRSPMCSPSALCCFGV